MREQEALPLSRAYLIVGRAATIRYASLQFSPSLHWIKYTYRRVSDLAILHRDIEVDADEDALVLEVEVGDGELVGERHGGCMRERCPAQGVKRGEGGEKNVLIIRITHLEYLLTSEHIPLEKQPRISKPTPKKYDTRRKQGNIPLPPQLRLCKLHQITNGDKIHECIPNVTS